ncbi:MAG TPA: universal stress protein [Polyangiaceae bacterium]|nr:universal stress protein [Polyangiaceae bacterium]
MILCGTDLSARCEPAIKAAAAFARKQDHELLLVHVIQSTQPLALPSAEIQLEEEAAELRRVYDISVETRVAQGAPDTALLQIAQASQAAMIVVGAVGASGKRRRLGSVPERLCQSAGIPVLVARDAKGLEAWSRSTRPLKVLLGTGLGDASLCALRCVGNWPDLALTLAHIAWPYGEHYRLGIGLPMPLDHLRPELHHQLLGDLGRWASETPCGAATKLSVTPGWGRIDSHLAQLASEKEVDLLVLGNHQRNVAERIWHGSVSRNAIHEASCNVLCVPHVTARATVAAPPRVIVAPTDFSPLADRAISLGYSLLQHGGTLHLVHVANDDRDGDRSALLGKLRARIPKEADVHGIQTELQVLDGSTPWLAIWQHAGRANADLICMSTHSKDAMKSLVLGSQAQALLQHSRIPVVLVPPDRES